MPDSTLRGIENYSILNKIHLYLRTQGRTTLMGRESAAGKIRAG